MRIDNLTPDDIVILGYCGNDKKVHTEEMAMFVGITGTGPNEKYNRLATFISMDENDQPYEWSAYRYEGGWAYGTSAQRLRLMDMAMSANA